MVRDWPKTTVVYPSPFSNPRATKRGLMAAMTVTCSQNAVEVTVKKQGLQVFISPPDRVQDLLYTFIWKKKECFLVG